MMHRRKTTCYYSAGKNSIEKITGTICMLSISLSGSPHEKILSINVNEKIIGHCNCEGVFEKEGGINMWVVQN